MTQITQKRPTIREVAQMAQVSVATVSRVMNKTARVAPDVSARVQDAIRILNFSPNPAARGLVRQVSGALGVLLPIISGGYFLPLLKGIESAATQAGYQLLIQTSHLQNNAIQACTRLGEHNTDGLLIFTDSIKMEDLQRLHQRNFPLVLLQATPPPDMPIPHVNIENQQGAFALTSHLIEVHQKRRIAFLRGPAGHEDSIQREAGYRNALLQHQLDVDETLISHGGFDTQQAYRATMQLLQNGLGCDAVFAGDDDSAAGVIKAFTESGVDIPHDVAVVGFDDLPLAQALTPALTTVHSPIEQIGSNGVNQLLKLINHETLTLETHLPTQLVIRQSCGCHP